MLQELRAASLSLHSKAHLTGQVFPRRPVPVVGIARFLAETRQAHVALRRFPVHTDTNFADVLDNDLRALSALVPVPSPGPTQYSDYLDGLGVPRLGCHWYNLVFAHISGGGNTICKAIAPSLPDECVLGYYESIHWEDADRLRSLLAYETLCWTPEQQAACVDETGAAFSHGLGMLATLSPPAPAVRRDM